MCPRREEPDGAVREHIFNVLIAFCWHTERRDPIDVLTGDSQGLAAGCEKRDAGAGAQQGLRHTGRRVDHMLAVVDDEQ